MAGDAIRNFRIGMSDSNLEASQVLSHLLIIIKTVCVVAIWPLGVAMRWNKQNQNCLTTAAEEAIYVKCRQTDKKTLHHGNSSSDLIDPKRRFTMETVPPTWQTRKDASPWKQFLRPDRPEKTLHHGNSCSGLIGRKDASPWKQLLRPDRPEKMLHHGNSSSGLIGPKRCFTMETAAPTWQTRTS